MVKETVIHWTVELNINIILLLFCHIKGLCWNRYLIAECFYPITFFRKVGLSKLLDLILDRPSASIQQDWMLSK